MLQFCKSAVWHGSLKSRCHQGCVPPWHSGEEFTSSPFLVPKGLLYFLAGGLFIFKDNCSPWPSGVAPFWLLPSSFLFLWPSVTSWVASDACTRKESERCLLVLLWSIRFQPHHDLAFQFLEDTAELALALQLVHILCLLHSGHPTWLFLVSLKASCPQRTYLDTQNIYILKALMYSIRLSSRSESLSVCPTLQPHGPYNPWNSLGQNTWVGSLSLLQGIFPTQGLNPGFPHCRWILYQMRHKGSPCLPEGTCNSYSISMKIGMSDRQKEVTRAKHLLKRKSSFVSWIFIECLLCAQHCDRSGDILVTKDS